MRKVHTGQGGDTLPTRLGKPINPATEPSAGGCRLSMAEAKTQRPASTRQGQRKASRSPGQPREPINPATEPSAGAVGLARPKPKRGVQHPRIRGSARYQGALAMRTANDPSQESPSTLRLSRQQEPSALPGRSQSAAFSIHASGAAQGIRGLKQ